MFNKMYAIFKKDVKILFKDKHAIAALFIMPVVFILIMSLAMKDVNSDENKKFSFIVKLDTNSVESVRMYNELKKTGSYQDRSEEVANVESVTTLIKEGRYDFFVDFRDLDRIEVFVNPSVTKSQAKFFHIALQKVLIGEYLKMMEVEMDPEEISQAIEMNYMYRGSRLPTSVQQSVPSWLVFSMFFVVIPISTVFISEKRDGTLVRLKSMGISSGLIFFGKITPFVFVNMVQAFFMILVGIYLVPLFGGDRLDLGDSIAAIGVLSFFISLAAISFALFVATLAKTTEQATIVGGISNILFGAIGGVMVPKFVMPPAMQEFANISPMSWGMDGYLDIFLRGAGVLDILPYCGLLTIFALIFFTFASLLMARYIR